MHPKYLHPDPPTDATIFEPAGGGGLVTPEVLFDKLEIGTWRKLDIDRLPMLDPPPDGFGELTNP